jgi:hypothetical protein
MSVAIRNVVLGTTMLLAGPTHAATQGGSWTLYPPQAQAYSTDVQQPINANGSSNFKNTGRSVIPVKFELSREIGPVVFQSIGSDAPTGNDISYLNFRPTSLLFKDLYNLSAVYSFSVGNCHGGSLRWTLTLRDPVSGQAGDLDIYYGTPPSYTECITPGDTQSGLNLITSPDARFEATKIGGVYYDTYANVLALVGDRVVTRSNLYS